MEKHRPCDYAQGDIRCLVIPRDFSWAIAEYLTEVTKKNDPALLTAALREIARAHGMSEIARASDISRKALYRA
ncbi:MAG: hypothetical protein RBR42_01525 [Desulfomicrobium sp.]|nr:hypothetical protein [Desulfomicrobium sp.]